MEYFPSTDMLKSMRTAMLAGIALIAAIAPSDARAQRADTTIKLLITLDRPAWLYATGDTARFRVSLTRAGKPIPGVMVRVELGHERMPPLRRDTLNAGAKPQILKATLAEPGFLRLTASAMVDSVQYRDTATAGFSPEKITSTTPMPADFLDFWKRTIAEARRTPLDPKMTKMEKWSTPDVDVYHISFQNDRVGSRLYGILSVPTREGKFPAVLVVPGAGVRPYFPDVGFAKQGVVHLRIGIHGIPVDRDSLLYNELRATALAKYWTFGIEDKETAYYRRVFAGVLRAGDFIFSLPKFDGKNYVVQGGSQGGGLAIVAGALDERVKGIVVAHPAMSDYFAYFAGKPGGWPHLFQDTAGMKALPEKLETIPYYDVVNFAPLVKAPGFYTWGYNDNTVPPSSAYAAYNLIRAQKELFISPDVQHFTDKSQNDRSRAWELDKLGVTSRR